MLPPRTPLSRKVRPPRVPHVTAKLEDGEETGHDDQLTPPTALTAASAPAGSHPNALKTAPRGTRGAAHMAAASSGAALGGVGANAEAALTVVASGENESSVSVNEGEQDWMICSCKQNRGLA